MITSSGFICDVCGEYILLEPAESFAISGNDFIAHGQCIPIVKEMVTKKDYKILPDGPLKNIYITQNK